MKILRSMLFVPATKSKFYASAAKSGADAIILDLEDSVANSEKETGRQLIKEAFSAVKAGGTDMLVRVNNDDGNLLKDIAACVWPGLDGIMIPKVEREADVLLVDRFVSLLEKERNLRQGGIYLNITIETTKGLVNARNIISSSPRIISVGLGGGDYCRDLGVVPSAEGIELMYAFSKLITLARAAEIQAIGILGTVLDVRDLQGFEQMAIRGRNLGSSGSPCVHPKQVEILNRVFSPSPETIDRAKKVVESFEKGLQEGIAAFLLDGKLVDYAVYYQAKATIDLVKSIEEKERKPRAPIS